MSLTKQARSRNPDDFPTLQLFLLGEFPPTRTSSHVICPERANFISQPSFA